MSLTAVSTMPGKGHLRLHLCCLVLVILSIGGCKAQECPVPCHCDFTPSSQGIVNCSYNRALSLDKPMPRNATVLDLRYTGLTEIPPHVFNQLESLKILYVGGNYITHFHEDSFAGLWALEHLDLSPLYLDTNFDYEAFPVSLFQNLTQLKVLIFGKMDITAQVQKGYLDETLAPLHRLQQVFFPGLPRRNLVLGPGYRNLTSLKTVVFHGHGSIVHLTKHAFATVKNCPIERLAFIGCGLDTVEYGTMSSFPHLKTLDIEDASFMTVGEAENVICDLNNTAIEVLRMSNIFSWRNGKATVKDWKLSVNTFQCLESASLKSLELLHDRITGIDIQNFDFLTHLEYLDLSGNAVLFFIENYTQPSGWDIIYQKSMLLSNLTFFRMDYNVYRMFMVSALDVPSNSFWHGHPKLPLEPVKFQNSLQKKLEAPQQNVNSSRPILKILLPENVEFWSSSWWGIDDNTFEMCHHLNTDFYFHPNKVRYLKIEDMNLNLKEFCPVLYGLDRLEFLDFSHNDIQYLPKNFFNNFISLIYLYLKNNNLGPLIARGGLHPIQLPHLEVIDLSVNKISTIPKDFFNYLASLKRLDLSDNRISTLSFNLTNLLSIEYIDINTNQLTDFSTSELDYIRNVNSSNLNVTLNMSNNPMDCNVCDGIGFLRLIIHSNMTTIFSNDSTCYVDGSKTSLESNLSRLERECDSSPQVTISPNQWLSLGAYLGGISVAACSLMVVYIYRWNIKYHFFLLRRRFRKRGVMNATPGHVYASYDDNDYYWVTHVLLRHLEDENQLDVIIDQRDFIGGSCLSEAIVEAVENSRKTVLVLSESYVLNPWCEFEFQMSLARGYQSVIPVMLHPVPFDAMTKSLRKYIKARGYIKWTEKQDGQRLFWKRLSDAIFNENDIHAHPEEDELTEIM